MLTFFSKQIVELFEYEMSAKILREQLLRARNSEIMLRSFFESSSSCHLLIGADFQVLAFNKTMEQALQNFLVSALKRR